MIPFDIENWTITADGIIWTGQPQVDYLIPRARLLELGNAERTNMYDFLIHMCEKTWLTVADIYTLNSAFIYAVSAYGFTLNSDVFVSSLIEQRIKIAER